MMADNDFERLCAAHWGGLVYNDDITWEQVCENRFPVVDDVRRGVAALLREQLRMAKSHDAYNEIDAILQQAPDDAGRG